LLTLALDHSYHQDPVMQSILQQAKNDPAAERPYEECFHPQQNTKADCSRVIRVGR
jgi:hypothetical protein